MNLSDRRIVGDLTPHVQPIAKRVPPRAIRTEQEYDTATASMNRLLDAGAADEAHPLAELVATRGELISNYTPCITPRHILLRWRCSVHSWISTASRRASWRKN